MRQNRHEFPLKISPSTLYPAVLNFAFACTLRPPQMSRVWGFALAVLPDLLNLVVVGILLYAAVISCGPIFNELLWTPDDAGAPPIEGRKWEDFDKSTRDILRTYKNGDVAPSGNHIEGWNRFDS